VSYFANISGLMTIRVSDGIIHSYNPIVSSILLGYDQNTLKNKPIVEFIPNLMSLYSFDKLKIDVNHEHNC
jgi:hypothetical protein